EGVSDKQYKLIRFYGRDVLNDEEWEFFDLKADPGEMKNGYANPEFKDKIAELKEELVRLRKFYKLEASLKEPESTKKKKRPGKKKKKQ
ncbi:MAG: DUF4976 domain-containing protein, partial [Proteobacteria bacterium]|nr:DUF4976 domain-containing protein [Pseudomonadota bacterium]